MHDTPLAESFHIVFFGLRNAGKSSLLNNIFEKEVAIVSNTPGTTTDPVTRKMELLPLGPVAITDTAGIDDIGDLGQERVKKSIARLAGAHVLILVSPIDQPPHPAEKELFDDFNKKNKNIVVVLSHADKPAHPEKTAWANPMPHVRVNNLTGEGVADFKKLLIKQGKKAEVEITPVEGLVNENDWVLLVTPIDLAAPKGRLILPQVETIRDLLDKDCGVFICKERELFSFYNNFKTPPKLVITDSQAFHKVSADLPPNQPLTSFSILFARKKGDLSQFVEGVAQLNHIKKGAKVLILESCSHHRQADDIGTVKIPRLFKQMAQFDSEFSFSKKLPTPNELANYDMVINCAGCTITRNNMLTRLATLGQANIPVVNYGLFLAWANGLLPRALEPFPEQHNLYKQLAPQAEGL